MMLILPTGGQQSSPYSNICRVQELATSDTDGHHCKQHKCMTPPNNNAEDNIFPPPRAKNEPDRFNIAHHCLHHLHFERDNNMVAATEERRPQLLTEEILWGRRWLSN